MTRAGRVAVVAAVTFAVDFGTKTLAEANGWGEPVRNDGLATGMVTMPRWAMLALTTAFAVAFVNVLGRPPVPAVASGLILGGALGNIADRWWFGSVRDFIDAHWLAFNVADVALAVGLVLGVWSIRQPAERGDP